MSLSFNDMYNETATDSSFNVRGTSYRYGYYLLEELYLEHACFVKSWYCPNDRKKLKFKKAQEKQWKDVKRVFSALTNVDIHFNTLYFLLKKMSEVMYTCIILHNMILEDEENAICEYNENKTVPPIQTFEVGNEEYLASRAIIYDFETHHVLRRNLTEHIWIVNHIDLNVEPVDDLNS
ncbi:uncharacterized protein LOC111912143 [Lactuca sativa]|uniref:uncharacterized protein LOC111912143 n=1 Tax=Lactuca sativa TaxID=4236 RepID=UPI000CD98A80|nr:uncharacterized protein LOC111912143 [Lactuca sativa]